MRIDLNCDLGEGAGHDAELMPLITSANIACGAYAGDAATMRATIALALRHGVAIGAHPGFADREHFGRRELQISPRDAFSLVVQQAGALIVEAQRQGGDVRHVKLHGALYNLAARETGLATAVAEAVHFLGSRLVLFASSGSELSRVARGMGLPVANEVFADRTYQPDGALTPRAHSDALITEETAAVSQVLRLVREGKVRATDGTDVVLAADTVCLHGDGKHAVEFARRLRAELAAAGIEVRAYSA